MGILDSKMDPISKAKHNIEKLKDLKDRLDQVSKTLQELKNNSKTTDKEFIRLYEKEFELSMNLSGLHEDIDLYLNKIKNDENELIIKRMKNEINKIFTPIYLEIK